MAKLVISLTDKQLKAAITNHRKEENKSLIKLADGNGLFLLLIKRDIFIGVLTIQGQSVKNVTAFPLEHIQRCL